MWPRRGAFVARMSRAEFAETYDVRAMLEGFASRLCAEHIGQKTILELEDALVQMRDAVAGDDVNRYFSLALQFQQIIWDNTPNRVLRELLQTLWRRSLKLRLVAMRLPGRMQLTLPSYEKMLEALRAHDARSAEMITWLQVQDGKRTLLNNYFSDAVRPDARSQLDRDLPHPDTVLPLKNRPRT